MPEPPEPAAPSSSADAYRSLGFALPNGQSPVDWWERLGNAQVRHVGALSPDAWAGVVFVADDADIFALRVVAVAPSEWERIRDQPLFKHVERLTREGLKDWHEVGPAAANGAYNRIRWRVGTEASTAALEWTRSSDRAALLRVTASSPLTLIVQAYCPWSRHVPEHLNVYTGTPDGLGVRGRALLPMTRDAMRFVARFNQRPTRLLDAGQMYVHAVFEDVEQIALAAMTGADFDTVEPAAQSLLEETAMIDQRRDDYARTRVSGEGALEGAPDAIANQLGWSVVYTPARKRRYVTVSRAWAQHNMSAPDFLWDSFLNALLIAQENPAAARDTVRSVLSWQHESGMLPQYGRWFPLHGPWGDPVAYGHSQYPIGSLCVAKLHCRHPDVAFLREVYPKLLKANRWWFADRGDGQPWRDGNRNGLAELGSNYPDELPHEYRHARACFESHDDSPQWKDHGVYNPTTQTVELDTVERNCTYAADCWVLAWMADQLGEQSDARMLRAEHARIRETINQLLWSPSRGCYHNRRWASVDGDWHTPHVAPDVFLSLLGRVAKPVQAERLRSLFHDPAKFAGEFILPTISRDDPAYPEQDYWRGKVWAPINWLVLQGFELEDWDAEADLLATSGARMFLKGWREHGHCYENYLATTGAGASDPHYTWGALMALGLIERYIDASPWHGLRFGSLHLAPGRIGRYPIDGRLYDVEASTNRFVVVRDGERLFETNAGVRLLNVREVSRGVLAFDAVAASDSTVRVGNIVDLRLPRGRSSHTARIG